MKELKEILITAAKGITMFAVICVFWYLWAAFLSAELNAFEWSFVMRLAYFLFVGGTIYALIKFDKVSK